jgi:polysaccharide export outer membrane protein
MNASGLRFDRLSKVFLPAICAGMAMVCVGCSETLVTHDPSNRFVKDDTPHQTVGSDRATSEALEKFGAAPSRYTLGPGDVISVIVWAHPELSGKQTIGPDGTVQVPFVGTIEVSNLTADEVSAKLTRVLSDYYAGPPAATTTINSYAGNNIIVLGHVAKPGLLHFADSPTLLEVLARAGAQNSPKQDISGVLTRCAIFRGNESAVWMDLRPLLRGDAPFLNIRLRPNDLVYVPDSDEQVYVMGQVKNPGVYPLTPNMSFLSAIAQAGGTNDNAQAGKIIISRPSQNIQRVIDLKTFVNGDHGVNYSLEAGDIVYVPKSGLAKVGYVLQQINPITQSLLFGAALF